MIKEIIKDTGERMKKAVDHIAAEYVKIRTGKASIGLLEGIKLDTYTFKPGREYKHSGLSYNRDSTLG